MGSNNPENNNVIAGAITYPVRNDGNLQRVPVQPRQPRNLQGLLRFAMEATKAEDAPGNSELRPMDEERRKFLEEALKSLTVDMAAVIQGAVRVLADADKMAAIQLGEPLPEDVENAFQTLADYIDDMDIANDFYKMGGFAIFPVCFGSENEEVRTRSYSVLGDACQNNPPCQERALSCGLLNVLLSLVATEQGVALSKCLYAISCATREYPPAISELSAQGGCAALAAKLAALAPAGTKAAFLVRYLVMHHGEARDQFIQLNIVKTIAEQIKAGRDEATEHLLSVLQALTEHSDSTVLAQCRDSSLGLKKILEDHLRHPDLVSDQFLEEKEYCRVLLQRIFDDYVVEESIEEIAER